MQFFEALVWKPRRRINLTLTVIYEKGETSWGAYVPDLPGVITVGGTREEAEELTHEAITFYLEGLREEGYPIPTPSTFAGSVEVNATA